MHVLKERLRAEASGSGATAKSRLSKGLASFLNSIVEHCALEEQARRDSKIFCRNQNRGSESILSQGLYKTFLQTILCDSDISLLRKEVRLRLVWLVWPSLLLGPSAFCQYSFEEVARSYHRLLEYSTCGQRRGETPNYRPHLSLALFKRKLLGEGSFAKLYLVTVCDSWQANIAGDDFALKEIPKRSTALARWKNERLVLRLLQKFKSPHIIKLVHWDFTEDNYRLLFPLAQHNLDHIMGTEPPAIHNLSVWALQQVQGLAMALTYCRHGDLKPENILWLSNETSTKINTPVDADIDLTKGRLVIADFGLAEIHSTNPKNQRYSTLNTDNELVHHRSRADSMYAAPEIEVPVDTRSAARAYDIWSLGCVFLELVVWMLRGPKARQELLRDLSPDVPGRSASYWQVDVAAQELKFSLKASVQSCLQLLLEGTTTNTRLRAATETIVYGGLLDPDPYARMTAESFGRMLLDIEEEQANQRWYISPHSNGSTPVWRRTWVTQYVLWNDLGSWKTPTTFAGDDVLGTLPRPGIQGLDIVDEEDVLSQSCDTDFDISEKDREQAPIKQECPYCKLEPGRPVAIKYHIKARHRTRQLYECPDCGYLLKDKGSLLKHRRGIGAIRPCPSLFSEHGYCAHRTVSSQVLDNDGSVYFRVDSYHKEDDMSGSGAATASRPGTSEVNSEKIRIWRSGGCGVGYHENDDCSGGSSSRDIC
jgi:serine/threonine protein kinase